MCEGDLRASSAAVLDTPISASSRSSSSRSCLRWYRRSHPSAIPASHSSGIFQDHLRSGNEGEAASRLSVELQVVLPQDMSQLRDGARQRLAARAHRAAVARIITVSPQPLLLKRWIRKAIGQRSRLPGSKCSISLRRSKGANAKTGTEAYALPRVLLPLPFQVRGRVERKSDVSRN